MPKTQCPTCKGSRKAYDPEWLEFAEQNNCSDRNTMRDCDTCEATGVICL